MSVGANIKDRRKELKLTLKELSAKCGISISFLSDIENGRSKPSIERLADISKALDVPRSVLLGEDISDSNKDDSTLTDEDIMDIDNEMQKLEENLEKNSGALFKGNALDDETRKYLLDALRHAKETALKITKNNDN